MARNPHFDRETIREDIGFRGPDFNERDSIDYSIYGNKNLQESRRGYESLESTPAERYLPDRFGRTRPIGAGIGSLGAQAGAYGRRRTPDDIRQESINLGQRAGLGNRISFAGEGGRDILNPNEMRVNAPSVENWRQRALRKMEMDRRYQQLDNPYYGQDQDWGGDLMAELSGKQQDWMEGPYGVPDFYGDFEDYFDKVTTQEDKGPWWQFGGGAQEPATEQEVIDQLKETYPGTLPWAVT